MEDGGRRCFAEPSANDHMKGESRESPEQTGIQNQTGAGRPERESSEDLTWLSSLPESQLDLLIGLKELAILRSRHAGHEKIAEKFDPRMLGTLGAFVLEYVKERITGSSIFPYSSEELESLSGRRMAPQGSQTPGTEDSTTPDAPQRKRAPVG